MSELVSEKINELRIHTGIVKLPNGRYRARYFAGYNTAGKRVYPARTFDTRSAAIKWRAESVAGKIAARDTIRPAALKHAQGASFTVPFAIPRALASVRRELLEIKVPLVRVCCVYFLISSRDEVLYVGQSVDLHQRIKDHLRAGVQFSRALFIAVQGPELDATEAYFIKALNPPLNKKQGHSRNCEPAERVRNLVEVWTGR